ncbi:MAG: hypothetical protein WC054_07535 [Candidatus Nanopelagicales bacterium]
MKKFVVLVVGALALTLSACGSSQADGGEDHTPVLQEYFNAFATDVAAQMEPMKSAAAPDSPAYLYAVHQINLALASESANGDVAASTATISEDQVTMVRQGLDADITEEQRAEATTTYSNFTYENGLLASWTANPGGDVAPRITPVSGSVTKLGVTLALKTAYIANSGDLFITYEVLNKSKKKASVVVNGYLNPDGRQVQVSATPYQVAPVPGAFASGYAVVTQGKLGGSLTIEFDYQTTAKLTVE